MNVRNPFDKCRERVLTTRFFIDESVTSVLFFIGISILAGVLLMMVMTSCARPSKKNEQKMIALENIRMTVEDPKSLHFIAFSELDSVYGKNYFSDEELNQILLNLSAFNSKLFGDPQNLVDFEDPKVAAQAERGVAMTGLLEPLLKNKADSQAEFNGWKMKVLYWYLNDFKDTVKNERYIIFDKSKQHIINSFDIPIL